MFTSLIASLLGEIRYIDIAIARQIFQNKVFVFTS
jgi:hypothetical protein